MNTYFVLNKKDRSGNNQLRPFKVVFQEMKRQEIEEAKKKQWTNFRSENQQHSLPIENGFDHSKTLTVETEINGRDDQSVKPSEVTTHSTKSLQVQSRSRTCELL
jgi:hypothetical protein